MGNKGIWQTPSAKSLQSLIPYSIRQTLPAKSQTASTASSQLGIPASELIQKLSFSHFSVTIDWTVRENARAQIRVIVKRILRKYGYPPDKQERLHRRCWNRLRCFAKNGWKYESLQTNYRHYNG